MLGLCKHDDGEASGKYQSSKPGLACFSLERLGSVWTGTASAVL